MLKLTQEIFGAPDPAAAALIASLGPDQLAQLIQHTLDDYNRYFFNIAEARRSTPREDLATALAHAQVDGRPISSRELAGYFMIIATAGHDTTSSSIAGAMLALAQDPALLAALQQDPGRLPAFVDEAIRWTSPVKTFMRSAAADVDLGGRHIAKGDWLMLCYASGNRDEAVFDTPNAFRLDRQPNRHLSFGYGAHLCLGQHLAKLEMRVLFETLVPRLEAVWLTGPPTWTANTFVNGLKTLPIGFRLV